MVYLSLICVCLCVRFGLAEQSSPCPKVLTYVKNDEDRWYGVISLNSRFRLFGAWIQIVLDGRADLLASWFGSVTTKDNTVFMVEDPDFVLEQNEPFDYKIIVKYNTNFTTPRIKSIIFNGRLICQKRQGRDDVIDEAAIEAEGPQIPRLSPRFQEDTSQNNFQCGVVSAIAQPLISHGKPTLRGQYPWHAVIYGIDELNYNYKCGGSLITQHHVLTAGHCVVKLFTDQALEPPKLAVVLGKFSASSGESHVIADIYLHPNFTANTLQNDIAVIRLARAVQLSHYVRTICLPRNHAKIDDVIGHQATVIGWGYNEKLTISNELRQIKLPIVSVDKCLESNRPFFSQFKTEFNFCAGFHNGTAGPCIGDSGGGLILPQEGTKNRTYWYIQGIVSTSPKNDNYFCNPRDFTLFTNVGKYLYWIDDILRKK